MYYMLPRPKATGSRRRYRPRKHKWQRVDETATDGDGAPDDIDDEEEVSADEDPAIAGTASAQQPLRGMNMNAYPSQPGARQTPRLQNTQKTAVGNGGWGSFGMGGAGGFGGAPGLAQQQARPGQLSGFAQVMGGGGQQGPIDMR